MTKLGHLKGKYERQEYIKQFGIKEASELIRVRLEMKDIGKIKGKEEHVLDAAGKMKAQNT